MILYNPRTIMNRRAKNFTEDSASAIRTTPLGEKELIRARITAREKMDQEGSRKKGEREEGEMRGRREKCEGGGRNEREEREKRGRREKREGEGDGRERSNMVTNHSSLHRKLVDPFSHNGIHTTQLCISSHKAAIANSFTTEGGTGQYTG